MDELVIKVPNPFSGIEDLGFTARYPEQERHGQLRDVPVIVEGPARPMSRLVETLGLFADKDRLVETGEDDAYLWTPPVQLSDEICVMAFRDQSLQGASAVDSSRGYLWNLVRPLAFTFLRDCVRIGGLRLSDRIAVVVDMRGARVADFEMQRVQISPRNGTRLLFGA
ncbi:MAG: hypothetical protein ABR541_02280 [Candidatus Dormibacteria bacterium]